MAIRVLRLIEYVYETEERAAGDMARWTHGRNDGSMTMRSATLPFEAAPWPTGFGDALVERARVRKSDGWLHNRFSHGADCQAECETLFARAPRQLPGENPTTELED